MTLQQVMDACRITDPLPWMSHKALALYVDGLLTDIGFTYWFTRMDSDLGMFVYCIKTVVWS